MIQNLTFFVFMGTALLRINVQFEDLDLTSNLREVRLKLSEISIKISENNNWNQNSYAASEDWYPMTMSFDKSL